MDQFDQFEQPEAKLLYAIYKLEEQGVITEEEKRQLKLMVVQQDDRVLQPLQQYQADKDYQQLKSQLQVLVRPLRQKPGNVAIPPKSMGDDISSPLGTFLHEKKKRQHAEHELKLSIASPQVVAITEEENH